MLEIRALAMTITPDLINKVVDQLVETHKSIVHVRAADVAFSIDAQTSGLLTQAEYNELVRIADTYLHPRRVAHFAAAYNL